MLWEKGLDPMTALEKARKTLGAVDQEKLLNPGRVTGPTIVKKKHTPGLPLAGESLDRAQRSFQRL